MNRKEYRQKLAETVNAILSRCPGQCAELLELLFRKNSDYVESDDNQFENFVESAEIAGIDGCERVLLSRLAEKFQRLKSLMNSDRPPAVEDEPIKETLIDIAGYSVIGIVMLDWIAGEGFEETEWENSKL